jgi:alpha-maltose-1-phosphate synthase
MISTNNSRPRVLVLAEKANPNWISVPLVGWKHIEAIQAFADVHLVTHERNRADIVGRGFPVARCTFVDPGELERWTTQLGSRLEGAFAMYSVTQTAFQVPMYYRFEQLAWAAMAERLARREFDLVHRVTPVSPAMPSLFASRCKRAGVPFVIGPINGGVPWAKGLSQIRRREGEWLGYLRAAHKLLPYYRSTRTDAAAFIVGSAAAYLEAIEVTPPERCFYLPENAIDLEAFPLCARGHGEKPLRVAYLGRLIPAKGPQLLLEAAAPLLSAGVMDLELIGEGPEGDALRSRAVQLGVAARVRFPGWVPHKQLSTHLAQGSVLCFPGVREFGGAVVMEGMALGLVPLVLDYGGPGEVVTDDTGVRVPIGNEASIIAGLRRALVQLAERSGDEMRATGERARARVEREFTLEVKAERTRAIYDWVLGRTSERPELSPPASSLAVYRGAA